MESTSKLVINEIIRRMQKKELQIGDRLPSERELAAELKVSRSSVREALSAMNMLGMIHIHPKGRTTLQPFNLGEFINALSSLLLMDPKIDDQINEYRLCIEMEAARLAALRSDGKALRGITEKMKKTTVKKQAEKLDLKFHLALCSSSGNQLLYQSSTAIMTLMEHSVARNRQLLEKRYPTLEELQQEHEAICLAIENNQPEHAASLIKEHLNIEKEEEKE